MRGPRWHPSAGLILRASAFLLRLRAVFSTDVHDRPARLLSISEGAVPCTLLLGGGTTTADSWATTLGGGRGKQTHGQAWLLLPAVLAGP